MPRVQLNNAELREIQELLIKSGKSSKTLFKISKALASASMFNTLADSINLEQIDSKQNIDSIMYKIMNDIPLTDEEQKAYEDSLK